MDPEKLVHLAYSSTAIKEFDTNMLINLLTSARTNNENLKITGILLYSHGDFFQILEGQNSMVLDLFAKVKIDRRHKNVTQIIYETIPDRTFDQWSMGFLDIDHKELDSIEGLNDFFTKGKCLSDIDTGRAKKLLYAFSKGYWRQSIK